MASSPTVVAEGRNLVQYQAKRKVANRIKGAQTYQEKLDSILMQVDLVEEVEETESGAEEEIKIDLARSRTKGAKRTIGTEGRTIIKNKIIGRE